MNLNFGSIIKLLDHRKKSAFVKKKGCGFRNIFLFVTAAFLLGGCSEDLDVSSGIENISEGTLKINLAVPAPEKISTRATDRDINRLDVFIYSQNGQPLLQYQSYENVSFAGEASIPLALNSSSKDKTVQIYVVANVAGLNSGSSIDDLRKKVLSDELSFDNGFPMIGLKSVNTSTETSTTVSLLRDVAKVSVKSSVSGVSIPNIKVYNPASKAYLGSPLNTEDQYKGYVFHSDLKNSTDPASVVYIYPSEGIHADDFTGDKYLTGGAYGVVEVIKKQGEDPQYYRVNFRREDNEGKIEYLDLKANHHYELVITGFFRDGYPSYDEAAKHPDSDQYLTYQIHDHASEILSMVTDGYSELGVTPEITFKNASEPQTIYVKCFTPGVTTVDKSSIEFEDVPDWLTIDFDNITEHDASNDYDKVWDPDSRGNQFEYSISITPGASNYDDEVAEIKVKWNGLERIVTVNFEASFSLDQACTVDLKIYEDGQSLFSEIKDYWTFVRGLGKNSISKSGLGLGVTNTPQLFGIKSENLTDGKKRTNGFHFPMPYGTDHADNPWTYVYEVDFTPLMEQDNIKAKNTSIQKIEPIIEGDVNLLNAINYNYTSGNSINLSFQQSSLVYPYEYLGGTITFKIIYANGETSEILASLYHTGFFHYEGNDKNDKYVPDADRGYYYYEVVPMAGDYWLDRNIGAKSNLSYIDTEDASAEEGREAGGLHYTIIKETGLYALPEWDFDMCPPGYHIPNTTEWDDVRLNGNFITRTVSVNNTLYMSTYYQTNNRKIGDVYFQKARFRNTKNIYEQKPKYSVEPNSGDAGAGYYWSVTEAPAMEKEHMGNWLRALYLNGTSSTYNNASITDHRMPIRCKAGTPDEAKTVSENYISFNVHNVTHVFLFDATTKTPLYTFPGRSVGSTESSAQWQHFYCSTTQDPANLLMLFVKLEGGTVTIFTKDNSGYTFGDDEWRTFQSTKEYSNKFLTAEYAWEVGLGKSYDFCEVGEKRESNVLEKQPTDCGKIDNGNGGGGGGSGGGGEILEGDYTWEGYLELWWGGFEELKADKYDWSEVKEGTTLGIYLNVYWYEDNNCIIRLLNGYWGNLAGANNDYHFSSNGDQWMYVTLTSTMLNDIKSNNGLVIQGNNLQIKGVTLTLAP